MKVVVTIDQGYMREVNVFKYDLHAYGNFIDNVRGIAVEDDDIKHDFDKDEDSLSYTSDAGHQVFMASVGAVVPNKKEGYVVCSFESWQILSRHIRVFTNKKEAWAYCDALRRESLQYATIIEEDGDKDNFLDDDGYAVFIEKATIYK